MNQKLGLATKINEKSANIGIVGLGYVGLPLALSFVEAGFKVIGFEIDDFKTSKIKNNESYLKHISSERIQVAIKTRRFETTADYKLAHEADALIICVPTPLDHHLEPDMSFVKDTINALKPSFRKGQVISLESTVYPGATDEEVVSVLEAQNFKVGEDVFVLFSPEREDPGNAKFHTTNIPKVVGGTTPTCLEVGVTLYNQVIEKVVPVSSTRAAEMTKLLENIYRAVNIGLVNELKTVADKMGINIWEVIDAAATKPFGFTPFYPGPGLGGHCIPIDPFYLTWKAKEYGVHTRFIELAGQTNWAMPEWVVSKVVEALNQNAKAVKGSKILVLGLAYKKNIEDMRESPSAELIKLLSAKGAQLYYADPYIPVYESEHEPKIKMESVSVNPQVLSEMDCVLLATDHDIFDYNLIQKESKLVVDTRGRYRKALPNVVLA
ncbi:MAG: nucleotide sugar dehydrogenase [Oligoflexia bacterium]|nr:nucleotide sugar dehydrogenase [Oligoflexia bacterium]